MFVIFHEEGQHHTCKTFFVETLMFLFVYNKTPKTTFNKSNLTI